MRLLRCFLFACVLAVPGAAHTQTLTVFAAASLKNALDEVAAAWKNPGPKNPGPSAVLVYGASSTLAKQIENGAPAQVFISADLDWMDYLEQRGLIRKETRRNLLGNTLVLVSPSDRMQPVEIKPGFPLAAMLGSGRLAIADPQAVPAGKYARAALEKLGVWSSVAGKIAPAENVRAALSLVARGEAPYGIVYGSDAKAEPKVRIAATFGAGLHPPIVYPTAVLSGSAGSSHPRAAEFIAFLSAAQSQAIFRKHGFTPPN